MGAYFANLAPSSDKQRREQGILAVGSWATAVGRTPYVSPWSAARRGTLQVAVRSNHTKRDQPQPPWAGGVGGVSLCCLCY